MANAGALFKRYLPKSLFWRAFLILVIPIVALQVVVASVFVRRHYDAVTEQMARSVAREIVSALEMVELAVRDPAADPNAKLRQLSRPLNVEMIYRAGDRIRIEDQRAVYDLTAVIVSQTLARYIAHPMALDFLSVNKGVDIEIQTPEGVLSVMVPRGRVNPSNPHLLLVWMTTTALGLTVVAVIFLRNQVRPIGELARAASDFGRGRAAQFRPRGADEVRRAGHAFLDMRRRIERQIGHRTLLLSGVSHDLRTPLTRMKLALAVAEPTPETREISRDVTEMERMIESFLDYVRGEGEGPAVAVDAVRLADAVAEDAIRSGLAPERVTRADPGASPTVSLKPSAMRRCLTNLLDNANRFGTRVVLGVRLGRRTVEFFVEDDGPGIPEERREEVLRPFTRLDESRNQDAGSGVGLGLAIASDIARGHGGALWLEESADLGGLRAVVLIPR
ncbi:MAG: ATP-binding protein [Pikeienuella sp.]